MKSIYLPPDLFLALQREGFQLPDECADVHVTMPVNGIMQLHYTINLTHEDLVKIGKAFINLGDPEITLHLDPIDAEPFE